MARPLRLDPLAERVLTLLTGQADARMIVLGGYLALQHHLDYRTTYDIDAWWAGRADPSAEQTIRQVMQQVATETGMVLQERRFGDTHSFELCREGERRFSFQIAARAVEIEEPHESAWPPLRIETLADNIGSKMNALVNRGAPRDFLDVYAAVDAGLITVARCWELWTAKNPGASPTAARQNLLVHLAGLDARRPLSGIVDPEARERARRVREWFKTTFMRE
jgi:hypothetical protein